MTAISTNTTNTTSLAVTQLVSELSDWQRPLTLDEVQDVIRRHPLSRKELDEFVRFDDSGYCHLPIATGSFFEIGCIGWRPGQFSPIHDHRGSVCLVQTIEGVLTNTDYYEDSSGHLKAITSEHYSQGEWFLRSDKAPHRLGNDALQDQNAVSLHIYSPPLVPMKDRIRCHPVPSESTQSRPIPNSQPTGKTRR